MATRAERFRAAAQRSKPPRKKQEAGKGHPAYRGTGKPGVRAVQRVAGGGGTGGWNASLARRATVAFEDSAAPNPPSRKSSRRSKNRQKAGAALKAKQLLEVSAPRARHEREAAAPGARPRPSRRF